MAIKFGTFVPQGWRMDLTEIDDPVEQYETMTRVGSPPVWESMTRIRSPVNDDSTFTGPSEHG